MEQASFEDVSPIESDRLFLVNVMLVRVCRPVSMMMCFWMEICTDIRSEDVRHSGLRVGTWWVSGWKTCTSLLEWWLKTWDLDVMGFFGRGDNSKGEIRPSWRLLKHVFPLKMPY